MTPLSLNVGVAPDSRQQAFEVGDQDGAVSKMEGPEQRVGVGDVVVKRASRIQIGSLGADVGGAEECDQRCSRVLCPRDDEACRVGGTKPRQTELRGEINDWDRTAAPPFRESSGRREAASSTAAATRFPQLVWH